MKEKLFKILEETNQNKIDAETALEQVFDLFIVSGSNCCKQCKEPIEKGFRFCSGECKQYYYR